MPLVPLHPRLKTQPREGYRVLFVSPLINASETLDNVQDKVSQVWDKARQISHSGHTCAHLGHNMCHGTPCQSLMLHQSQMLSPANRQSSDMGLLNIWIYDEVV